MQNSVLPGRKTIYIIRHGQTDFNKQGIIQGSGVDTDLNETGRQQGQNFYDYYRLTKFDKIYISKLQRTAQTVAPFRAKEVEIEVIPELNEINWGIMEGAKPTPATHKKFLHTVNEWAKGNLDERVEKGESANEMYARQKIGFEKIMSGTEESQILICMHGRAMRSFLCLLTGAHLSRMDKFEHGNVCLYVLEKEDSEQYFRILVRNSRMHLHTINL